MVASAPRQALEVSVPNDRRSLGGARTEKPSRQDRPVDATRACPGCPGAHWGALSAGHRAVLPCSHLRPGRGQAAIHHATSSQGSLAKPTRISGRMHSAGPHAARRCPLRGLCQRQPEMLTLPRTRAPAISSPTGQRLPAAPLPRLRSCHPVIVNRQSRPSASGHGPYHPPPRPRRRDHGAARRRMRWAA